VPLWVQVIIIVANFFLKLPCPRSLDFSQEDTKKCLINIFNKNCFSPINVNIQCIQELTSTSTPCCYELICTAKFDPEDQLINENEGNLFGREELIHHVLSRNIIALKLNIKDKSVQFYHKEKFKVSIVIDCNCPAPIFWLTDKVEKLTMATI
jgi:hypothetical protein